MLDEINIREALPVKVGERDSKPKGRVLDVMALELPPNCESIK